MAYETPKQIAKAGIETGSTKARPPRHRAVVANAKIAGSVPGNAAGATVR
jgi:hypothetical protein